MQEQQTVGAGKPVAIARGDDGDAEPSCTTAQGGKLNMDGLEFDVVALDGSIIESGLSREFDVNPYTQRKLAAQAMTLMSIALGAVSDEEFERFLSEFDAPASACELAFIFGFCEHVRQDLIESLGPVENELALRAVLRRRTDRARLLCNAAMSLAAD